ncbi:MAG: FG-GAP repeat protein [Ignavibacteria bacterium]|nr:FG-GAP repeat protein [Ignavibacteria bacterium]
MGYSVSSAGDVNGDGYSDVIVGEHVYSSETGRAHIYFGGDSMNNTADVIMTGEAADNQFGSAVSSAGDVNGDGYSDVIIGASLYSSYRGKAYIFLGSQSMNNTVDIIMTGEAEFNRW